MGLVFFFNLMFFIGLNGTTTFLNFTFLVSLFFIRFFVFWNVKFFGGFLFSLTTPSNLNFLPVNNSPLFFVSSFLLTRIESVRKNIRPVSLTCRLGANISARHLLSAMFFGANPPFFGFLGLLFYYIFEVLIAIIQGFVFSFLLLDYKESFEKDFLRSFFTRTVWPLS